MSKRSDFPCPMIMRDIDEYESPIDGRMISSRSAKREDLKRSGCVEYEPQAGHRKGYENPHFIKKHKVPRHLINDVGQEKLEREKKR